MHRQDQEELDAVGTSRVETLLNEAGIAERPHSSHVRHQPKLNLIEVEISMVAKAFLPVDVWGENPIVVIAQARAFGQSRLYTWVWNSKRRTPSR